MPFIFETERLRLQQFSMEDAALILSLNSDPEVLKYLHEPALSTISQSAGMLENIILPQYTNRLGRWAVYLKDINEFIGWCGLKYRPEIDEIDLGYRFMKSSWGKGYATEAAIETLRYGFNTLHLPLITGRAHIENIPSQKVMEKIGMKYISEGIVDDCPVKTYIAGKGWTN